MSTNRRLDRPSARATTLAWAFFIAAAPAQPPPPQAATAPETAPARSVVFPAPEGAAPAANAASAVSAELEAHRRAVEQGWRAQCPGTVKEFEVFVDLNALRTRHPEWFSTSPLGPGAATLGVLELSNARAVTLHGWRVPAGSVLVIDPNTQTARPAGTRAYPADAPDLLVLELTASARSDPPGTVADRRLLTLNGWPADRMEPGELRLGADAPGTPVGIVRADSAGPGTRALGAGFGAWVRLFHKLYVGSLPPAPSAARPDAEMAFLKWQAGGSAPQRALMNAARPWVLVSVLPPRPGEADAGTTVRLAVPLNANAPAAQQLVSDLAAALGRAVRPLQPEEGSGFALASAWGPIASLRVAARRPVGSLPAPGDDSAKGPARPAAVEATVTLRWPPSAPGPGAGKP